MSYGGTEKRRHPRIEAKFMVSYHVLNQHDSIDLTQTKNLSLGGMLLTTNRKFDPDTRLALEIRLPFDPYPIMIVARVIKSDEVINNLIYNTRLEFLSIDERHKNIITQTVDYYLKRGKK